MEVIGLLGHQGVGKNYLADLLQVYLPKKNTLIVALADHFKIGCISKYNVEYDKVFVNKDFKTRKLLQKVGTEEGRNKYGDDIWIRTLENWMKLYYSRGINRFIISDLRFPNEVEWVRKLNGLIIKIEAPERYKQKLMEETKGDEQMIQSIIEHPSEKQIDDIKLVGPKDFTVKNDPGDNLDKQLEILLTSKY